MKYTISHEGENVVATLKGPLLLTARDKFEELSAELLEPTVAEGVIDLADVTQLDSAGLGLLLVIGKRAQGQDIPITLRGATGAVRATLENAEFDRFFAMA